MTRKFYLILIILCSLIYSCSSPREENHVSVEGVITNISVTRQPPCPYIEVAVILTNNSVNDFYYITDYDLNNLDKYKQFLNIKVHIRNTTISPWVGCGSTVSNITPVVSR